MKFRGSGEAPRAPEEVEHLLAVRLHGHAHVLRLAAHAVLVELLPALVPAPALLVISIAAVVFTAIGAGSITLLDLYELAIAFFVISPRGPFRDFIPYLAPTFGFHTSSDLSSGRAVAASRG